MNTLDDMYEFINNLNEQNLSAKEQIDEILLEFNCSQSQAIRLCNFVGFNITSQTLSNWHTERNKFSKHAREQLIRSLWIATKQNEFSLQFGDMNFSRYHISALNRVQQWLDGEIGIIFGEDKILLEKKDGTTVELPNHISCLFKRLTPEAIKKRL